MAADLHIHVLTETFTEEHLAIFCGNHMGSRWWDPGYFNDEEYLMGNDPKRAFEEEHGVKLYELAVETPNVWVGEVSWLKAALFEDEESFVPPPVYAINDIIGEELPVIDDRLIQDIKEALSLDNQTGYSLAQSEEVLAFLEEHKGKQAFTISW